MSKRSNGEGTIYKHKSGMWCAQYLYKGKRHSVYAKTQADNLVKRIERDSGIKSANIHSFRHTFATRCIESGMDILVVSYLLGHAQASTTVIISYGHTNQSSQYSI